MKKTLLLVVCLMTVGMQSVMAVTAQIVLRHQGNVKQFNPDELPSAIEAAENGDTILLSAGTFKYSASSIVTINKAITIIGVGANNSVIDNSVYIDIPNNPVLTAHLLDGVNITRELYIVKSAIGIKIRKCVINNKISYNINSDPIYEMLIDRCDINNIGLNSVLRSLTVTNSKAQVLNAGYTPDAAVFSNCNVIIGSSGTYGTANFINCYITTFYNAGNSIFTNCLASVTWKNYTSAENCYTYTPSETEVDEAEYFRQQGWLGTDGTIVGMYGGTTPFTLEPNAPKVTDYTIGVDTKTRMLNVKMTLSAN